MTSRSWPRRTFPDPDLVLPLPEGSLRFPALASACARAKLFTTLIVGNNFAPIPANQSVDQAIFRTDASFGAVL